MTEMIKKEIEIKAKQVTNNLVSFMSELDTKANKQIKELELDIEFYKSEIEKLEQKLEQTEKDLADYQFNYPTIKELQKENAELTCQMKRNTYCFSCINATEKCYRKEIGCPCGDYKFYKDEITELEADFIKSCKVKEQGFREAEQALECKDDQLAKAKEIITALLNVFVYDLADDEMDTGDIDTKIKAEQFLKEIE